MAYSDKVVEHYNNPRNVGSLPGRRPQCRNGAGRRAGVQRRDEIADENQSGHQGH